MIVKAPSDSGKTTTLAIGILQLLDTKCHQCQVLVLTPTMELAQSFVKLLLSLGEFMPDLKAHACLEEGNSTKEDICTFCGDAHIVVGTASSIYQMVIERKALSLSMRSD
jgi:superfamily II DNA/RNA helicase